jgi:hypothetical protein
VEAAIVQTYPNAEVTLIESGGGIFEVKADNKLIFSTMRANRLPRGGEEIVELMAEAFPPVK